MSLNCTVCGSNDHVKGSASCEGRRTTPTTTQGDRYNEGKARVDLIPAIVLIELGKHYTYGANKYVPNNWVKGLSYSETSGSLLRHWYAWQSGESHDPESGNHHLLAVIWNAMTLLYFELYPSKYKHFDDRVVASQKDTVTEPSTGLPNYDVKPTEQAIEFQGMINKALANSPACEFCGGKLGQHYSWCVSKEKTNER